MGDQIGHIGRGPAAKLSPYMDNSYLLVEGAIAGTKGQYDCPINLKLFGPKDRDKKGDIVDKMRRDRLPLDAFRQRAKEEKLKQIEELKKLKAAQKSGRVATGSGKK